MSKRVHHGKAAREDILLGVDFLANVVKVTEGPRGRNVILGQRSLGQSPKVTKDGVTVSNYADPVDPVLQLGADLIREAAQKTDNAVGDGTTASIVLAQAMIHKGFDLIDTGANPMSIERGIHQTVEDVVAYVKKMSVAVEGDVVFQVATVSAHGDTEIGRLVADAISKAGKDGVVTAEPSITSETTVESVAGIELEKSNLISTAFVTHPEDVKCEFTNARILLWEGVIATARSLVPLLQQVASAQPPIPLLIIAGGYEQEALSVLITNRIKHALPLNAVRMEAYGERRKEIMRDIAALTGGKAYTEDMGTKIESVKLADLGSARKVITTMAKTQIIEGKGNLAEVQGRVDMIRKALETEAPVDRGLLRRRLAALVGGITIIKVGGITVTEMEEKKDRVVDAMSAAKAAVESGVVPGGGMALFRASLMLSNKHDEGAGALVIQESCRAITRQIIENAGRQWAPIEQELIARPECGFNAFTESFEDLVATGIIDPTKVVIESLRNASAVACSILTMGAAISEVKPNA